MAKRASDIFSKEIEYTPAETDEDITLLLVDPLKMDKDFLIIRGGVYMISYQINRF